MRWLVICLVILLCLVIQPRIATATSCTVPLTDSGSQLIIDINTCLASAGGSIPTGTNGQILGYGITGTPTAYTIGSDVVLSSTYQATVQHFTLNANSSAGNQRITNLSTDSTTGDALSRGQSTLNSLSGVSISSPANGQALCFNGSNWINSTACVGSGGGGGYPTGTTAQLASYNTSNTGTAYSVSGDMTLALSGSVLIATVSSVNGVSYPTGPSTSTVPIVSGPNTITYERVPLAAGGTSCGGPTIYASLGLGTNGETCTLTDAASCVAGTAVTSGGLSGGYCQVVYLNGAWMPAGGATSSGGGGGSPGGTTGNPQYYLTSTSFGGAANAAWSSTGALTGTSTSGQNLISSFSIDTVGLNPVDYTADPSGANFSTTGIQDAVNAACPSGNCQEPVDLPPGIFKVTQLNFANLINLVFRGAGAGVLNSSTGQTVIECDETTNNSGTCIDMSGTAYITMQNIQIINVSGHAPREQLLLAKTSANAAGFVYNFQNVTFLPTGGDYGLYDYGGEQFHCLDCYWNGSPNVASALFSVSNTPGVTNIANNLPAPPTSMTGIDLAGAGSTLSVFGGTGVPLMFDAGGGQSIEDVKISGYCNHLASTDCITDYSSADTGNLVKLKIDGLRDEPQGTTPGSLVAFNYTNVYGATINANYETTHTPSVPTAVFAGVLFNSTIDIYSIQASIANPVVKCPGTNVLGVTIVDYYSSSGLQVNSCPGAAEIHGIYGNSNATMYNMTGLTLTGITGSTQCLQVNSSGVVSGTGSTCGSGGGGSGTVTASPQYQLPYYANSGTANVITGTSALTFTGGTSFTTTDPWTFSLAGTGAGSNGQIVLKDTGGSLGGGSIQFAEGSTTQWILDFGTGTGGAQGNFSLVDQVNSGHAQLVGQAGSSASVMITNSGYSIPSTVVLSSLAISSITGSTQCLEISSTGVVSGTGSACGSGGGAVNSVTGTTNEITASPTSGAVVLSIPSTFIAPGSIASTTSMTVGGLTTSNAIPKNSSAGLLSESSITDNGTTVATTEAMSTGPLTATVNGVINPQAASCAVNQATSTHLTMGAVGDGSTDDTAAIQNAVLCSCGMTTYTSAQIGVHSPHPRVTLPATQSCYKTTQPIRLFCGGLDFGSDPSSNVWGAHAKICPNFAGPALVDEAPQANDLPYTTSLLTGTGNSFNTAAGTYGSGTYVLVLTDYINSVLDNYLANSQLGVEMTVNLSGLGSTGILWQVGTADPGSRDIAHPIIASMSVASNGKTTCSIQTTTSGVVSGTSTDTGFTLNANHTMSWDWNGSDLYCFRDGTEVVGPLAATGSLYSSTASGTGIFVTSNEPELATVYWPDAEPFESTGVAGSVDGINISQVALHTAAYTPATTKPTVNSNTMLILNFESNCTSSGQANCSPDSMQLAHTSTSLVASGNVYLPIRSGLPGTQTPSEHVHDLELCPGTNIGSNDGLFALWSPQSEFDHLSCSNANNIGFNFAYGDFEAVTHDIQVLGNGHRLGFNFGGAYNESRDSNLFDQAGRVMSVSNTGGGTFDSYFTDADEGWDAYNWIYNQTKFTAQWFFTDTEDSAPIHLANFHIDGGSYGSVILDGQITSANNAPYFDVFGGYPATVIGTQLSPYTGSTPAEVFNHVDAESNNHLTSGFDMMMNTLVSPSTTPLSNPANLVLDLDDQNWAAIPLFLSNGIDPGSHVFYADQCKGMHNDGVNDDAAPLRTCMAAMPSGSTMNLDGSKPYYFTTNSTSVSTGYAGNSCELYVGANTTLNLHGATLTASSGEQSVSGNGMICAGGGNDAANTPGAGGSLAGTYDAIADTAAGANQVILTTHAHAANYNNGDDIYIDCGCNASVTAPSGNGSCSGSDVDVFIGWDQVQDVNSSTGVINLMYPMQKPYVHNAAGCPGTSINNARIYDWTTEGGSHTPNQYQGPMQRNVYIHGGGATLNIGAMQGLYYMSVVNGEVDGITINTPNYNDNGENFLYANANHFIEVDHNNITNTGCTGDTSFNAGEFTSSINKIDFNRLTMTGNPGTGCGREVGFGDSEGDESQYYSYNTCTMSPGGVAAASVSVCGYTDAIWNDTFDHENYTAAGGTSGIIAVVGDPAVNDGGITTVTNSLINTTAGGNAIIFQQPGDSAIGNTLNCSNASSCLFFEYYSGPIINNTVNEIGCAATTYGIYTSPGALISGNTVTGTGSCTIGIYFPSGGGNGNLVGNVISGFGAPSNISSGSNPGEAVSGNPGIADYNGSGNSSPSTTMFSFATALSTSATSDYWYPIGSPQTAGTSSNYMIAPFTATYNHINCTFSAAQGSGNADTIYVDDSNVAFGRCDGGAWFCAASNSTTCSASTGSCLITAGDPIRITDTITGSGIAARNAICTLSQ